MWTFSWHPFGVPCHTPQASVVHEKDEYDPDVGAPRAGHHSKEESHTFLKHTWTLLGDVAFHKCLQSTCLPFEHTHLASTMVLHKASWLVGKMNMKAMSISFMLDRDDYMYRIHHAPYLYSVWRRRLQWLMKHWTDMDWSPHLVVQSGHRWQPTRRREIKHLPDEYMWHTAAHFKEHIHAHLHLPLFRPPRLSNMVWHPHTVPLSLGTKRRCPQRIMCYL